MALIVEDGSNVPDADSYTTLAQAQAFVDTRALSVTLTEALLLRAMDALVDVFWVGEKVDHDSALPWPRSGVYSREGYLLNHQVVPAGVRHAQIWIAYYIQQGIDPSARPEIPVRSETVGPISTVFAIRAGERDTVTLFSLPNVRNALRDYWTINGSIDRA